MQGKNYRRLVWVTTLLLLSTIVRAQQERFVFTTAWMAQAQFAGYYVAYERGFYKEAGLDVDIVHAGAGLADQFQVRRSIQEGCRHLRLVDYEYVAVADSFESFLRGAVPVCDKLAESLDRGE